MRTGRSQQPTVTPLTSTTGNDIFIAKYSPTGVFQWAKHYGLTGVNSAFGVAVDSNNNIVVVGQLGGTVDFGGGVLTSAGGGDVFVAKLSSSGAWVWSVRYGSTGDDLADAVAVDAKGDVFIGGRYGASINFGSGALPFVGTWDMFVAKFSGSNGGNIWAKGFGTTGQNLITSVGVGPDGNVVFSGQIASSVNFGGGTLTGQGGLDAVLVKLSSTDGSHVWSKLFGGIGTEQAFGVAVDPSGNVFVTGMYNSTIDFGGGSLLPNIGGSVFLAKYSPTGAYIWAKSFGIDGTPAAGVRGIAADSSGNVAITGFTNYAIDFGGGYLFPPLSSGNFDVYIAEFNSAGTHIWSKRAGGGGDDFGNAVAMDASGNVFTTGQVAYQADFGCGLHTISGGTDAFLAKSAP